MARCLRLEAPLPILPGPLLEEVEDRIHTIWERILYSHHLYSSPVSTNTSLVSRHRIGCGPWTATQQSSLGSGGCEPLTKRVEVLGTSRGRSLLRSKKAAMVHLSMFIQA